MKRILKHFNSQKSKVQNEKIDFIDLHYLKKYNFSRNLNKKYLVNHQIFCVINCIDCMYDDKLLNYNNISEVFLNTFIISDFIHWLLGG